MPAGPHFKDRDAARASGLALSRQQPVKLLDCPRDVVWKQMREVDKKLRRPPHRTIQVVIPGAYHTEPGLSS